MALRRAGPQDVATIRALVDKAHGKWVPLIGRKPWPMTVDYAQAVGQHDFLLLHVDGVLAGLVETIRGDDFVVENLAVSPRFQKQASETACCAKPSRTPLRWDMAMCGSTPTGALSRTSPSTSVGVIRFNRKSRCPMACWSI